jgi:cyclophilin family peptidyl-prolyl cis-trans isomerase
VPSIGTIDVKGALVSALIVSDVQKAAAVKSLPKALNPVLTHDAAGVLGMSGPNGIYLTLDKNPGLDTKSTAIGRVIAGANLLKEIAKGDGIQSVRFTRVGQAARDFKADDEAFAQLVAKATAKK